MRSTNPERNLEVYNEVPLPYYLSNLLNQEVQGEEQGEILGKMLALGFRVALGTEKRDKYYFQDGQNLTRIKIGPLGNQKSDEDGVPFFNTDEFLYPFIQGVINPQQDSRYLVDNYKYSDGTPIQLAPQAIQDQSKDLVAEAAEKVRKLFPGSIPPQYQIKLERAKNGVVVVKDLSRIGDHTLHLPKIIGALYWLLDKSFKIETYGANIKPYDAIMLDEGVFTNNKISPAKRLETATHETLHLISDNNLPSLLNEGATDTYAQRAIGIDVNARNRATGDIRLGYDLWNYLEKQVGAAIVWQAYLDPSSFRVVRDKDTLEEIKRNYTGLKLHDLMRELLDGKPVGESRWDQALELMNDGNMLKATDLIYPLRLRLRNRISALLPYARSLDSLTMKAKSP